MKKLVIANWKMNPESLDEARKLVSSWEHRMHLVKNAEVVVCAPNIFLPALFHYTHNVKLGAQNMSWEEKGAFTGEISPTQLKPFKTEFVLFVHS